MFAERFKKLRQEKGYTQEKVANDLDVPESSVRRWETDKGYPKNERLPAIADYFNCSIDYLLGRDDRNKEDRLSNEQLYAALLIDKISDPEQRKAAIEVLKGLAGEK